MSIFAELHGAQRYLAKQHEKLSVLKEKPDVNADAIKVLEGEMQRSQETLEDIEYDARCEARSDRY